MYDVNPLGPLMHLKEIERQAISAAYRNPGESRSNIRALLRERLAILLRRILSNSGSIAHHKKI